MNHIPIFIGVISLICTGIFQSSAQIDSVLLPTVEVISERINLGQTGGRTAVWDSVDLKHYQTKNIGELLQRNSGVFIKSYGLGSIATSSIRGGSTGHTAIVWNGFQLNSPMLGLLDLSLLPVQFADQVSLQYGGSTALWGNGAIGGVIAINNLARFNHGFTLEAQSTVGSFEEFDQQLNVNYSGHNWSTKSRLNYYQAKNDFAYQIHEDSPAIKQTNTENIRKAFMQDVFYKINDNQQIAMHLWWQNSARQIPPTTTQNKSEAHQNDDLFRLTMDWKRLGDGQITQTRFGYFDEQIDYQDPQILFQSITKFKKLVAELEQQWTLSNAQIIHAGIQETYSTAKADAYAQVPDELRSSVFATYKKVFKKSVFQISMRQSFVAGELQPFVPSFAFERKLSTTFEIKAKISRNYRLPTFNDRYWRPGGDQNLKAEQGWSEEATIVFSNNKKTAPLSFSTTIFNRNINDWILWAFREGESFVSVGNIASVWSRGIENRFNYKLQKNKWKVELSMGYDFIKSTNKIAIASPRIEIGEQLIYVPKHRAFASLLFAIYQWQFQYQHSYTGGVSTLNESLEGYSLAFLSLRYHFSRKTFSSNLFFNIENLGDTNYRVVERRPMPGRSFQFGIQFNFK